MMPSDTDFIKRAAEYKNFGPAGLTAAAEATPLLTASVAQTVAQNVIRIVSHIANATEGGSSEHIVNVLTKNRASVARTSEVTTGVSIAMTPQQFDPNWQQAANAETLAKAAALVEAGLKAQSGAKAFGDISVDMTFGAMTPDGMGVVASITYADKI